MVDGRLVSFGSYTFPTTQSEFNTNFGDITTKTIRVPGMDGGFSQDGWGKGDSAIGRITFGFWLVAEDPDDMEAKRDAVLKLAGLGLQKLIYQPEDATAEQRWCWARVNYPTISQNFEDGANNLFQRVQMIFHVPDPRWYSDAGYSPQLADGSYTADGSLYVINGYLSNVVSNATKTFTVVNDGTHEVIPAVLIEPGAGASIATNPKIQRIVDGYAVDEVQVLGDLYGHELAFDGKRQVAMWDGKRIFGSFEYGRGAFYSVDFKYKHPAFLRLAPGSNTIKVTFDNLSGGAPTALVLMWFEDGWR